MEDHSGVRANEMFRVEGAGPRNSEGDKTDHICNERVTSNANYGIESVSTAKAA